MKIKIKNSKLSKDKDSFLKSVTFTADWTQEVNMIEIKAAKERGKEWVKWNYRDADRIAIKEIRKEINKFFRSQLEKKYPAIEKPKK